jgi:hypothetical protein
MTAEFDILMSLLRGEELEADSRESSTIRLHGISYKKEDLVRIDFGEFQYRFMKLKGDYESFCKM